MHTPHPDTHQHGFDDECPRCQKYPTNLTDIDAENLRRIWSGSIITRTDMDVYNALYRAAVVHQRLVEAFHWDGHTIRNPPDGTAEYGFDLFKVGGRS